ncbi:MAG TPA: hypothetical protein VHL34_16930 [Rhizomicrobium sp.]|jgi:hypothetical protein|nr:hypothetical protein [Rhizomicrobium sp.]
MLKLDGKVISPRDVVLLESTGNGRTKISLLGGFVIEVNEDLDEVHRVVELEREAGRERQQERAKALRLMGKKPKPAPAPEPESQD